MSELGRKVANVMLDGVEGRSVGKILTAYLLVGVNSAVLFALIYSTHWLSRTDMAFAAIACSLAVFAVQFAASLAIKAATVTGGWVAGWLATVSIVLLSSLVLLPWSAGAWCVTKFRDVRKRRTQVGEPSASLSGGPEAPVTEIVRPAPASRLPTPLVVAKERYQNSTQLLTRLIEQVQQIEDADTESFRTLFELANDQLANRRHAYRDVIATINYRLAVTPDSLDRSLSTVYRFKMDFFDVLDEDLWDKMPASDFEESHAFRATATLLACWFAVASLPEEHRMRYVRGIDADINRQLATISGLLREQFKQLPDRAVASPPLSGTGLQLWAPAAIMWIRLGGDDSEQALKARTEKMKIEGVWATRAQLNLSLGETGAPVNPFEKLALALIDHVFGSYEAPARTAAKAAAAVRESLRQSRAAALKDGVDTREAAARVVRESQWSGERPRPGIDVGDDDLLRWVEEDETELFGKPDGDDAGLRS